jgi:glycosyltransferase involved in cell wall biosynthesis
MRLLLVTPYFPPQAAIASRRVHSFAQTWTAAGHHVTVLTTRKRPDQCGLDLRCDGFEVVELPFHIPPMYEWLRARHKAAARNGSSTGATESAPPGSASKNWLERVKESTGILSSVRMPDLTDYWVKPAITWAQTHIPPSWDAVVSCGGPYTAHLVAAALKKARLAARFVADFRDLWTDNHMYPGLFPFTVRERRLERSAVRQADLLTTVSEPLAESLRSKFNVPVEVIYNGYDEAAWKFLPRNAIFPSDGRFRIVFTGTLYSQAQGVDPAPFLDALRNLQAQGGEVAERILLVTAGRGFDRWVNLARRHGVADLVEAHDVVSSADALRMQRDAQALLLLDHVDARQGVLTGKLFEYLCAAAPILVVGGQADSPIAQIVRRADRGINLVRDEARIARTIIDLLENGNRQGWPGDRDFIQQFSRKHQATRFLGLLRDLHCRIIPQTWDFLHNPQFGPRI